MGEKLPEKLPELTPEMKNLVTAMALALKQQQTQQPDEWAVASAPMTKPIEESERKELEKYVLTPTATPSTNGKHLQGYETGTFLDKMFLDETMRSLGGIPMCAQIGMTGLSGSGKSLIIDEIALKSASKGKRVCLILSEDTFKTDTARLDVQSRLIQKAKLLGLDWEVIRQNIWVLDTITSPELREWKNFAETYRYVCERHRIELTLIDSITVLETSRYQLRYRVIELVRYNQLHGITAIFVNQRGEERDDVSGMTGGYNLDYQYDITVIIDFLRTNNFTPKPMLDDLGVTQDAKGSYTRGDFIRYARILDSRLCGYNRRYQRIEITDTGFVQVS